MDSYLTRCLDRLQDAYHDLGLSRINGNFNDEPLMQAVTALRNHQERREFYDQFRVLRADTIATENAQGMDTPDMVDLTDPGQLDVIVQQTCAEKMLQVVEKVDPAYVKRWQRVIRGWNS